MDSLVELIRTFIETHGLDRKYFLAYSGGLDSHVLLHLFAKHNIQLRAIYINHGMNAKSTEWAQHCEQTCRDLNVKFIQQNISEINPLSLSNLEEQLRQSRYQLFQDNLAANEILLTAHHQNDQAETILMQLCRGAGPQGLSAMPKIKSFGQGFHARPLLDFSREDLLQYAKHHKLNWIEDESNLNSHFTRNFLRHEIMPILTKRWPSVTKTLARAAENCADAQQFIELSSEELLTKVQGTVAGTLSVKKILLLKVLEQRHVLRSWIAQAKFSLPSTTKLQQIMQTLLHAREDKMPHVHWGKAEIRRYQDNLFLMRKLGWHDAGQILSWDIAEPLVIPNIGILKADLLSILDPADEPRDVGEEGLQVQFRKGGETLQLPGRLHHHDLKKCFQTWGVPPWLRNRVPLVYLNERLIAVVGFWIDDIFARQLVFKIYQAE